MLLVGEDQKPNCIFLNCFLVSIWWKLCVVWILRFCDQSVVTLLLTISSTYLSKYNYDMNTQIKGTSKKDFQKLSMKFVYIFLKVKFLLFKVLYLPCYPLIKCFFANKIQRATDGECMI